MAPFFHCFFRGSLPCYCYSGDTGKKKLRLLKLLEQVHLSNRTLDNPNFHMEEPIPWAETQAILDAFAGGSHGNWVLEWFEEK